MQTEQTTSFGEEVKAAESWLDEYRRGGVRRRERLCANPGCRWNKEARGGTFTHSERYGGFVCEDCLYTPLPSDCKDRWHFTTTHFNGQPIEVKGANHLRELEKQFGVSNHAFNYNQSNWDSPPSVRPQPMNPELDRMLGKAREMGRMDRGSRISGEYGDRR